jgi:hypothetical protein
VFAQGDDVITRYAVRNQQGQWFRSKGYGGYGTSWTDDQAKARLYGSIGQARSRRTFFATRWPDFGAPEIVKFECEPVVIDDSEQLAKAKQRAATKKEQQEANRARMNLERAQREFDRAQQELARAKAGA